MSLKTAARHMYVRLRRPF